MLRSIRVLSWLHGKDEGHQSVMVATGVAQDN